MPKNPLYFSDFLSDIGVDRCMICERYFPLHELGFIPMDNPGEFYLVCAEDAEQLEAP